MRHCTQFSQHHMSKMLSRLPHLSYVDLDGCREIYFPAAYWILSSLPSLRMINFVPGNSKIELAEWKRLFNIFYLVSFGISFRRILPFYGSYVHGSEIEE